MIVFDGRDQPHADPAHQPDHGRRGQAAGDVAEQHQEAEHQHRQRVALQVAPAAVQQRREQDADQAVLAAGLTPYASRAWPLAASTISSTQSSATKPRLISAGLRPRSTGRSVRCIVTPINGSVGEVTTIPAATSTCSPTAATARWSPRAVPPSGALSYDGRDLVQGFPEDRMPSAGRGQVLMPWPNRIRDGAYTFAGAGCSSRCPSRARHNASHGLVRWVVLARRRRAAQRSPCATG